MAKRSIAAESAAAKNTANASADNSANSNTANASADNSDNANSNTANTVGGETPNVRTKKKVVDGNPIVKVDGKEYEIKTPLFSVSGFGTFTNKEAATNKALLKHLIEKGSSVLKEVF